MKKAKNNIEAEPIKEVKVGYIFRLVIIPLILCSFLLTMVVFINEYNEDRENKIVEQERILENRFEYVPKAFNGACPSGTTSFDSEKCLKLKNQN